MLKALAHIVSIFLIIIIYFRASKENRGLANFAEKSKLLGSPASAERILNILTGFGVLIYFLMALLLNLSSTH